MGCDIPPAGRRTLEAAVSALVAAHDAWAAHCKRMGYPPGSWAKDRHGRIITCKEWIDAQGGFEAFAVKAA